MFPFSALLLFVLPFLAGQQQARQVALNAVVARTTAYVEAYTRDLGQVVTEERYTQRAEWSRDHSKRERTTVSDFRTMPIGDQWFGRRYVRTVDGVSIDPQFEGRLEGPYDLSSPQGRLRMQQDLALENARYTIGDVFFPTNTPTFPLEVFRKGNVERYTFLPLAFDNIGGDRLWKIQAKGKEEPLTGTFWIDPESGRIRRAQIEYRPGKGFVVVRVAMDVLYSFDSNVQLLVPISMDEECEGPPYSPTVSGHADYSNARHFSNTVQVAPGVTEKSAASELTRLGRTSYALKVDVPVVNVHVWVLKDNVPTTNLHADDFVIEENGVPQTLSNFSTVETPYDVLLLFDRSGSLEDEWPLMREAAQTFMAHMRAEVALH